MVNWSNAEDAKLLVGILEYSNIPLSKGLLDFLAKKIGPDCTAKAVSHRLNNIKSRAKGGGSAPATPKTPRTKSASGAGRGSAPKSSAKRKGAPSNGFGTNGDDIGAHVPDDDDLGSILGSPSSKKRKILKSGMEDQPIPLDEEDGDEFQDAQEAMIKSEPLEHKNWDSEVREEHFDELDDDYV